MVRRERSEEANGSDIGLGLVNGLLISIPLWVILGVVLALVFHHGPMEEASGAALTIVIAAVCEVILLRPYLPTLKEGIRRCAAFCSTKFIPLENVSGRNFDSIEDLLRYVEPKHATAGQSRPAAAPHSLVRQSLSLSALVGAYLQYYFLEVNLQIASLHALTVFVPVASMS